MFAMLGSIIALLGNLFLPVMSWAYRICGNYGIAVFLFAFIVRVVLFPISIILHKNSIKMVRMMPELNMVNVYYHGDRDRVGEEQTKLYRRYHYHPMLGLIPIFLQLIILMGVIGVIYKQLTPGTELWGCDISFIPAKVGGKYIEFPIIAALSAWLLCFIQDRINVLQSQQSKLNKLITMIISVGLSFYLGYYVPAAVGIYWACGNLLSIIQLVLLNLLIDPKKHIDYEKLAESRKALEKIELRDAEINKKFLAKDPYRNKEKEDYKRFYSIHNKQIVFYSEKNGYYKYYRNIIEYILDNSDVTIHYVTGDAQDYVFRLQSERFRVYYIGNKRIISFMLKMDSNVVVMTTPDLDKYFIKKSLVRKDIEYIYFPHGVSSPNSSLRTGALDNFDTCFVEGPRAEAEIRAIEKLHGTQEKRLIPWGSCVIENMIKDYEAKYVNDCVLPKSEEETILIAPSWQDDNIIDTCAVELIKALLKTNRWVILRPHPQYVRYGKDRLDEIDDIFRDVEKFTIQRDFSSIDTVYEAALLVTDWSGIAYEYAFSTLKPVLFINTPMKVMNPEWKQIDNVPLDIALRSKIGSNISPQEVVHAEDVARELLDNRELYKEAIRTYRVEEIYNLDGCGKIGGEYVLEANRRVDDNKEEYLRYL